MLAYLELNQLNAISMFVQERQRRPRLSLPVGDQEYLTKESESENPFCDLRPSGGLSLSPQKLVRRVGDKQFRHRH